MRTVPDPDCPQHGPSGYLAPVRDELDRLRAENAGLRQLLDLRSAALDRVTQNALDGLIANGALTERSSRPTVLDRAADHRASGRVRPAATSPNARGRRVNQPALCAHHRAVYATRLDRLRHNVHHPDRGRKNVLREARLVARQCAQCLAL